MPKIDLQNESKRANEVATVNTYTRLSVNTLDDNAGITHKISIILSLVVIMSSTGEQVLRKLVASNMYNYRWFLVQLLSLFAFVQAGICLLFQLWQHRSNINHIFPVMRPDSPKFGLPMKSFFYIAILDTAHSVCLVISLGIIPSTLSVLLPQLLVPITMFFHAVANNSPCYGYYFIGGLLIFSGCLVSFIEKILYFKSCDGGRSRGELIANGIMLIVGIIPSALSSSYKKYYLEKTLVNLYAFNWITSGFQFLIGFFIAPLAIELQYVVHTPINSPHATMSSSLTNVETSPAITYYNNNVNRTSYSRGIFDNFAWGWKCIIKGVDSEIGDVCEKLSVTLGIEVIFYIFSVIILHFALIVLMQHAQKLFIVPYSLIVSMMISLAIFEVPAINNLLPSYLCKEHVSVWTLACVAVIILGLLISHYHPPRPSNQVINVWQQLEEFAEEYRKQKQQRAAKKKAQRANH